MGVRVMSSFGQGMAALYDSVTDTAFGPIFYEFHDMDAEQAAHAFLDWLGRKGENAARLTPGELELEYSKWRTEVDMQRKTDEQSQRSQHRTQ